MSDLYPAVLVLVMVGLILAIGLFVLQEVRLGVAIDKTGTDSNVPVNGTSGGGRVINTSTLGDSTATGYNLVEIVSITYEGNTLPVANYTASTAGVVTYTPDTAISDWAVNVTSTYNSDAANSPEKALTTSLTGLSTFADWIALIVVVIAAAVVLGLVLGSFGREPGV